MIWSAKYIDRITTGRFIRGVNLVFPYLKDTAFFKIILEKNNKIVNVTERRQITEGRKTNSLPYK